MCAISNHTSIMTQREQLRREIKSVRARLKSILDQGGALSPEQELDYALMQMESFGPNVLFDVIGAPPGYLQEILACARIAQKNTIDGVIPGEEWKLSPIGIANAEFFIAMLPDLINNRTGNTAKTDTKRNGHVYLLKSPTGTYKIGRTKDPSKRLHTFSVKLPFEVEFVCVIAAEDMIALETELHRKFKHKRVGGEWFALSEDDVAFISQLAANNLLTDSIKNDTFPDCD